MSRTTGRWRIYYGDGSTYSDRDGSPFDAPAGNVQVISQEQDNGRCTPLSGIDSNVPVDCYRWNGEAWTACQYMDLPQYYLTHEGPQKVLLAYEMNQKQDFLTILERAIREGVGD